MLKPLTIIVSIFFSTVATWANECPVLFSGFDSASTIPHVDLSHQESNIKTRSIDKLREQLMSNLEFLGVIQHFVDKRKEQKELETKNANLDAERNRLKTLENAFDPELEGGDRAILESALNASSAFRSLLQMNVNESSLSDAKRNSGRRLRQMNKHEYPWILIKDGTKYRLDVVLSKAVKVANRTAYKEALTDLINLINSFTAYEKNFSEIGNVAIVLEANMRAVDRALLAPEALEKFKTGKPVIIKVADRIQPNMLTHQLEVLYRGVEFNNIQSAQAFRQGIQKAMAALPVENQAGKVVIKKKFIEKYLLVQAIQLWKIEMIQELLNKYIKQVGGTSDHKRLLELADAAVKLGRRTIPMKYHQRAIFIAIKNEILYSFHIRNKMTPEAQRIQSVLELHGISNPIDLNAQVSYSSISDLVKKHLKKLVFLTATLASTVAFDSFNLHETENYSFNFDSISNYVVLGVNEEVINNAANSEFFNQINLYISEKYGLVYEGGLIHISGLEDQTTLVQGHLELLRFYDNRIETLQASPVDIEFKSLLQSLRATTHNQLIKIEMSRITLIDSEQLFLVEFQKLALNYYGVQLPLSELNQIQLSLKKSEIIDFGSAKNAAEAKRQFVTALILRQG